MGVSLSGSSRKTGRRLTRRRSERPCRTDMHGFVAIGLGIPPMMLPERKTVRLVTARLPHGQEEDPTWLGSDRPRDG
jgi:hypothetical protein